ncbi:MAG TPA: hypothetical protein VGY55_20635 [Pirellulales bacterium]|jgi:hypothetical protein|nr:hypothetical protein [Pirellulales bacterium]
MVDEFQVFPMAALFLPGTVALPSPFPTVGTVWLPSPDFECMPGISKGTELIAIGKSTPPSASIVRYVRVEHVAAIFLLHDTCAEATDAVDWKHGNWLYKPSSDDLRRELAARSRAIVYVPENAPVMTQAVFGATAAESAEYLGYLAGPCDG